MADRAAIQAPVRQFLKNLNPKIKVDELIVFGSRLEGTDGRDSDIDLVVISDDFSKMSEDERLLMLHKAARGVKTPIDPWGFTSGELKAAMKLTTLGQARDKGSRVKIK